MVRKRVYERDILNISDKFKLNIDQNDKIVNACPIIKNFLSKHGKEWEITCDRNYIYISNDNYQDISIDLMIKDIEENIREKAKMIKEKNSTNELVSNKISIVPIKRDELIKIAQDNEIYITEDMNIPELCKSITNFKKIINGKELKCSSKGIAYFKEIKNDDLSLDKFVIKGKQELKNELDFNFDLQKYYNKDILNSSSISIYFGDENSQDKIDLHFKRSFTKSDIIKKLKRNEIKVGNNQILISLPSLEGKNILSSINENFDLSKIRYDNGIKFFLKKNNFTLNPSNYEENEKNYLYDYKPYSFFKERKNNLSLTSYFVNKENEFIKIFIYLQFVKHKISGKELGNSTIVTQRISFDKPHKKYETPYKKYESRYNQYYDIPYFIHNGEMVPYNGNEFNFNLIFNIFGVSI